MNVPDVVGGMPNRPGNIHFLDIQMKQIRQQFHVRCLEIPQQARALPERVDDVGFVAIERLIDQRDVVLPGMFAEIIEGRFEIMNGGIGINRIAPTVPASIR